MEKYRNIIDTIWKIFLLIVHNNKVNYSKNEDF